MSDVSELILKVKGVEKAKSDLSSVQNEMKKTGDTAKNMFTAMASGWGFKQLLEFSNKMSTFWEKNTLAVSNFRSIFGSFNKEAERGVKNLVQNFDETSRTAKMISSTIGNMLTDLNLSRSELGRVVADLTGSVSNIAAQHGADIQQVARKIGSALRGEVDGLKELGIVIQKDGIAIQESIKQFRSQGFGQKEAETLAIAKELIKNSSKFERSFTDIQSSFAHQIGNLKNTLESGIFVGIGKIFNLLSPLLVLLNKILENKWVIAIASITSSIVILTSSMKLLMVTSKQLVGVMKFLGVTGMFGKDSNFSYMPLILKRTFVEIAAVFEGGWFLLKNALAGGIGGIKIIGTIFKDLAFNFKMFSKMQKNWTSKDFSKFMWNFSKNLRDSGAKEIGHTITNWLYKIFDFKWINNSKVYDFAENWEKGFKKIYETLRNFQLAKPLNSFNLKLSSVLMSIQDHIYRFFWRITEWFRSKLLKNIPIKLRGAFNLVKRGNFATFDITYSSFRQLKKGFDKTAKSMISGSFTYLKEKTWKVLGKVYTKNLKMIKVYFSFFNQFFQGTAKGEKVIKHLLDTAKEYKIDSNTLRKMAKKWLIADKLDRFSTSIYRGLDVIVVGFYRFFGNVSNSLGMAYEKLVGKKWFQNLFNALSNIGNKIGAALMTIKYSMLFKSTLVGGVAIAIAAGLTYILTVAVEKAIEVYRTSPAIQSTVQKVKYHIVNTLYKLSLVGTDIATSIKNFVHGGGFESDTTKATTMMQELNTTLPNLKDSFATFRKGVKEFTAEWTGLVKGTVFSIDDYVAIQDKIETRLKSARSDFKAAEESWKYYLAQANAYNLEAQKYAEKNKYTEAKQFANEALSWSALAEDERGRADRMLTLYKELLGKYKDAKSEIEAITKKINENKFDTNNLFSDFDKEISGAFGKMKLEDSIKFVNDKIKILNEKYFDNGEFRKYFNNEDQRQYYTELANLEKSKFDLEVENLQAEGELIRQNRQLIQDTISKMMEFKAQGIGAINANSSEGYKFMTSSIGSLSSLKPVLDSQKQEESTFRQKTISIQTKTRDILEKIKEKMDVLNTSETSQKLIIVN